MPLPEFAVLSGGAVARGDTPDGESAMSVVAEASAEAAAGVGGTELSDDSAALTAGVAASAGPAATVRVVQPSKAVPVITRKETQATMATRILPSLIDNSHTQPLYRRFILTQHYTMLKAYSRCKNWLFPAFYCFDL